MCGIVAVTGKANSVPVLIEGLRKLEYRGYDSAGLAVLLPDGLKRLRSAGRVAELAQLVLGLEAPVGIAHTRWATHGAPCERNAHPHTSSGLAVVHNGIIENHETLCAMLQGYGYRFESETDSETLAHLIHHYLKSAETLFEAVQEAARNVRGAYAIAVVDENAPQTIVVARNGAPLLLGIGEEGMYAASDAAALVQVTRRMIYLENGDVAELTFESFTIVDESGKTVTRTETVSQLTASAIELGLYRHYMQKEIFEQPDALANTLEMLGSSNHVAAGLFGADAAALFDRAASVLILACGTSYYAGMTARYWIESIAKIPVTVEVASEYRYRDSVPRPDQLVVAISQSGETADTLAALRHARSLGQAMTLGICNVPESSLVRECALRFITRAGPEIGVASTKAFTTQLAALFLLALLLAKARGRLDDETEARYMGSLRHLPVAIGRVLELEDEIRVWAEYFANKHHALFLGRGRHYPIALEGALKLKELSYIHAEAYPAGELKHGPLALVDRDMPVVAVAPRDVLLEKLKSNLQEVRARGGVLYVFADGNSEMTESEGLHILRLPEHYGELSPILHVVPLQLLAYHAALVKGTDVDKPRNLAKSVTVE